MTHLTCHLLILKNAYHCPLVLFPKPSLNLALNFIHFLHSNFKLPLIIRFSSHSLEVMVLPQLVTGGSNVPTMINPRSTCFERAHSTIIKGEIDGPRSRTVPPLTLADSLSLLSN